MKERLLGAAVLIVAAVLLIPVFLDGPRLPDTVSRELALPVPESGDTIDSAAAGSRIHTVEIDVGTTPSDNVSPQVEKSPPAQAAPAARSQPAAPAAAKPAFESAGTAEQTAVSQAAPTAEGWAVQVGSFTSESNARRLAEHLKDAGYPAFVVRNVVKGRVMFRVRVGPESDRLRAEALVDRLKSDRQQTQLVRHP